MPFSVYSVGALDTVPFLLLVFTQSTWRVKVARALAEKQRHFRNVACKFLLGFLGPNFLS